MRYTHYGSTCSPAICTANCSLVCDCLSLLEKLKALEYGSGSPSPGACASSACKLRRRAAVSPGEVRIRNQPRLLSVNGNSGCLVRKNPLTPFLALLYFVPTYFLSALLLRHMEGRPALETGGKCWEGAMRYQNWSFIIALVLLVGIMLLKRTMGGSLLVLASLIYTMVRTSRLRRKYGAKACALSLQQIVEVEETGTRKKHESLLPYARTDAVVAEVDEKGQAEADRGPSKL